MATLPESGSARDFFLLKGSRSIPQSRQARSGREIGPSVGWISLDYDYNELNSKWLELDCIIEVP